MSGTYSWDSKSALRKATSDAYVSVTLGNVSISKQVTSPHNPQTDAYRACSRCGKHLNYHRDGKCP